MPILNGVDPLEMWNDFIAGTPRTPSVSSHYTAFSASTPPAAAPVAPPLPVVRAPVVAAPKDIPFENDFTEETEGYEEMDKPQQKAACKSPLFSPKNPSQAHILASRQRAHGVVVSRLLRMQKALGSNPSGSILFVFPYFAQKSPLVKLTGQLSGGYEEMSTSEQ